uniref:Uncharacterized protein n=1 Tax=Globisporangium ultimum (strain ATCC 200006 / CBS 805.95 / DAOM BR144) TaxID=431595 RepID=K3X6W9_GLOUD
MSSSFVAKESLGTPVVTDVDPEFLTASRLLTNSTPAGFFLLLISSNIFINSGSTSSHRSAGCSCTVSLRRRDSLKRYNEITKLSLDIRLRSLRRARTIILSQHQRAEALVDESLELRIREEK